MLLTWGEEGAASLSVEEGEGGVSGSELGRRWGGGPGGHRVGTGPREQLSRQFYSTPPTTRAAIDDISTLLQKSLVFYLFMILPLQILYYIILL